MSNSSSNDFRPGLSKDAQAAGGDRLKQRSGGHGFVPLGTKSVPAASQGEGASRSSDIGKTVVGSADERCRLIAERAYFIAEQRQFTEGDPVDDWLQAEHEIDRQA